MSKIDFPKKLFCEKIVKTPTRLEIFFLINFKIYKKPLHNVVSLPFYEKII